MTSRLHKEAAEKIVAACKLMVYTIQDLFKMMEPYLEGRPIEVFESYYITPLLIGGKLEKDSFGLICAKVYRPPVQTPANLFRVAEGSYAGAELGRTCLRPGAYDFLDKPSEINGVLTPYRK